MFHLFGFILVLFSTHCTVESLIDGLYCGKHDCYTVLGISRDATKSEIGKMYRQLAKKHHPDMHKTLEAKKKAAETFTLLSTAYEVLKDEESRKDYDYMLDNPDKVYGHYYRYYRRRMSPKVDARIVIAITVTVISVVQYLAAWSRYRSAINHLITVPKYRLKALEIARKDKLLEVNKRRDRRNKLSDEIKIESRKGIRAKCKTYGKELEGQITRMKYDLSKCATKNEDIYKDKEQIKEEEETVLKTILEEMMDIRGGHSKPLITDILWIQLIFLPYTSLKYVYWNMKWLWKFGFLKQEYGEEEKLYLIKRYLQCSKTQWDAIPDDEKEMYLNEKLWIRETFDTWKRKKEDDMKAKLAESARYKSYRRYMKNHGPGQLTLDDI